MHTELCAIEGLEHRAVVGSGCVAGSVLGAHSVSFEYYGAGVSTAQRLAREAPWGSVVALSGVIRTAAILAHDGRVDDDTLAAGPVSVSLDQQMTTTWSASERWQIAFFPPCRVRLLKAKLLLSCY